MCGVGWAGSAAQAAGTTSNANGDLAVNLCYLFMSIATETTGVFSVTEVIINTSTANCQSCKKKPARTF